MRLDLEIQRRVTKQNRQIKILDVDKGKNTRRMKTGQTFTLLLMMDITDFRFEDGDADYMDEI